MTASIRDGLRLAARHPRLVCLLWAWYGLLALVPALPAWRWWNGVLGPSPEAASVLTRFDLGVFLDLASTQGVNGLGLLAGAAMAVAAIALVSSAFAFGGILEVFGSEGEPRTFMHRFFRGGGHFFWRYLRLALIAGVCLVLATGAVSALMTGATAPLRESEWEPAGYLLGMANLAVLLAVAALFLLALDYARIRVSRDDARSMLKAYASGLGFVLRRLVSRVRHRHPVRRGAGRAGHPLPGVRNQHPGGGKLGSDRAAVPRPAGRRDRPRVPARGARRRGTALPRRGPADTRSGCREGDHGSGRVRLRTCRFRQRSTKFLPR